MMLLKCTAVKNFNSKNPTWRTAAMLKIGKSRHVMMKQKGSLAYRQSAILDFEIGILNGRALHGSKNFIDSHGTYTALAKKAGPQTHHHNSVKC